MEGLDFQRRLIEQIGDRVSKIREDRQMTQKETIQGNKVGEGGYSASIVSNIEKKKMIIKKEKKNGKVYKRLTNLWTDAILSEIAENLNVTFEEIIFGDEKNIESNVKWMFDEVVYNFGTNLYPVSTVDKNFYTMKYPDFENVTDDFWDFFMFDAELSNRYEGYCFDELTGLLAPFFENRFKEDLSTYKKKMNLKKKADTKAVYRRKIADAEYLEPLNRMYRQNNFHKEAFLERNQGFSERFEEIVDWVWTNEKSKFTETFKVEFVDKAKEEFSMLQINDKIIEWINKKFPEIIRQLHIEYLENEILSIGYQIADLYALRNDVWLQKIGTSNSELSKIKKESWSTYEDQIADLTEIQEKHWNIKIMRSEIPALNADLKFADLT